MVKIISIFPVLFFLWSFAQCQAISISELVKDPGYIFFNNRVQYITTKDSVSLIEAKKAFQEGKLKSLPDADIYFHGYDPLYFTYRFLIVNPDTIDASAICMFGGRGVRQAEIAQYSGGREVYKTIIGHRFSFESRPYAFARLSFPIIVKANSVNTIYLVVDESYAAKTWAFMLFNPQKLLFLQNEVYLKLGWILGLLSIFFLLNVYLHISLNAPAHAWYAAYIFFISCFVIKYEGLDAEFFGFDSELAFRSTPMVFFGVLAFAFLVRAVGLLLIGNYRNSRFIRFDKGITLFGVIISLVFWLGFFFRWPDSIVKYIFNVSIIYIATSLIYIIFICIKNFSRGNYTALFILAGIGAFLFGASFRLLGIGDKIDILPPFYFERGLVVEVVIISFGIIYQYNLFRKERDLLSLELKAKELETTRQLVETLEEEQERIARDLHDELSGNLAALQVHIHASALSLHEKIPIENILTEAAQSARQIAHNLMPPAIENIGLQQLLASYFDQFLQNGHPHFHFFYSTDTPELEPRQSLMVYRIVLELVNNIITHSQATEASVQINFSLGHFRLAVEDNGTGMPANNSGGMGLRNIRNRTTYLGGKVDIDSSGKGTSILISFPIEKKEINNEENADNTGR